MAVATPVLERNEVTEEKLNYGYGRMAEEEHNARIKRNYAMLINPETKLDDMLGRSEPAAAVKEEEKKEVKASSTLANAREILLQKPYLVENARADAEIFRADSPVNRKICEVAPQVVAEQETEEEENEDLRPTLTTIQYKTTGAQATIEEGKIVNTGAEKRAGLAKRDKIIVAVIVSVIVALFALIIINSAIISSLNSDIGSLQSSLTTVKGAYAGVSDQVALFSERLNEAVDSFARLHGMVRS